jgi:hypothetical protein
MPCCGGLDQIVAGAGIGGRHLLRERMALGVAGAGLGLARG